MLKPRIIPCLLVHNRGLYKTINFKNPTYVGDPLNAVKIFNEKQVDELMVVDIDASRLGKEPDYQMISNIASECRMPLCYGGGVKNIEQFERIVGLGVEKVAVSSAVVSNLDLLSEASVRIGSQSVVVVMDVKRSKFFNKYDVVTLNAKKKVGLEPAKLALKLQNCGVGEIVINSVDRDGTQKGYDFDLIDHLHKVVETPITVLGGAGSLEDIKNLFDRYGTIGAGVGSLFVFKGKYRAVLLNYPNKNEKSMLYKVGVKI